MDQDMRKKLSHNEYTVAFICALNEELTACRLLLDEEHYPLIGTHTSDTNSYRPGRVHGHNVVIACLPAGSPGVGAAAVIATNLLSSFHNIRFGLVVGIGGGVPSTVPDIRLGDVVISTPEGDCGGVVQYDLGKETDMGFKRTGSLNRPPDILLNAITQLRSDHSLGNTAVPTFYERVPPGFRRPDHEDKLYRCTYRHQNAGADPKCDCCSREQVVHRLPRVDSLPAFHYGIIASGSQVMRSAKRRESLGGVLNAMCFEMEAAGLMNSFSCLVVRGISDYCDSHKNDTWKRFAAIMAAAWAGDLLRIVRPEEVRSSLTALAPEVKKIKSTLEQDRIWEWLSSPDPGENHNIAIDKRQEGTLSGILEMEPLRHWKNCRQSACVWLYGKAGSGKTVLSASLIESLKQVIHRNSDTLACYYFDFRTEPKTTHTNMIRSLALQICSHNETSWSMLCALHDSQLPSKIRPSDKYLQRTVEKAASTIRTLYVVIDALDECESRQSSLKWFKTLLSQPGVWVKLLITSREQEDIRSQIAHFIEPQNCVSVERFVSDEDIEKYVRGRLVKKRMLKDMWKEMTVRAVMEKANGMFLWAACQLDQVETCRTEGDLEAQLSDLPNTMDETYERILRKVNPRYEHRAIRLLEIMLLARRPLRLAEAVDVLNMNADGNPYGSNFRLADLEDVASICPHLFAIDRDEDPVIRFVHVSVKEYLLAQRDSKGLSQPLNERTATSNAVRTCIQYLRSIPEDRPPVKKSPFALSAATMWFCNARKAEQGDASVGASNYQFLVSDKFKMWLRVYKWDSPDQTRNVELGTKEECKSDPLYYAALGGLDWTVKRIIQNLECHETSRFEHALKVASYQGHEGTVRILLEKSHDSAHLANLCKIASESAVQGHNETIMRMLLNTLGKSISHNGVANSVLIVAASAGMLAMVEDAIAVNADVNADRGAALRNAATHGHEHVLRYLLFEKNANVNAQSAETKRKYDMSGDDKSEDGTSKDSKSNNGISEDGTTALHCAAMHDRFTIAQLLIYAGADVNLTRRRSGTALRAACVAHAENIVQLLIEEGADVTLTGEDSETAFEAACAAGAANAALMLIQRGAAVCLTRESAGIALRAACTARADKIVQLLIDLGVDVNFANENSETALQAACTAGAEKAVRLLIHYGADVNYVGGQSGSALHAAARCGHAIITRILLDNYADITVTAGKYGSVLHTAVAAGQLDIVGILIKNGANVNAKSGEHGTALQLASFTSGSSMVRGLLDAGANQNVTGGKYNSALQAAFIKGKKTVVELLIENSSDTVSGKGRYRNVIQAAALRDWSNIVGTILYEGGDRDSHCPQHCNALWTAAYRGNELTVEYLLRKWEAPSNEHCHEHCTALAAAATRGRLGVVQMLLEHGAEPMTALCCRESKHVSLFRRCQDKMKKFREKKEYALDPKKARKRTSERHSSLTGEIYRQVTEEDIKTAKKYYVVENTYSEILQELRSAEQRRLAKAQGTEVMQGVQFDGPRGHKRSGESFSSLEGEVRGRMKGYSLR